MKRLITIITLILLFGCERKPSDHPVFRYLPPENVFEDGFVSKYYRHYYPDNPDQRASTEVSYTKYIKLNDSSYITENYNAGFDLESRRYYVVESDQVKLEKGWNVNARDVTDTTHLKLLNKTTAAWEGEMQEPFRLKYTFGENEYIYSEYQKSVSDTIINGKAAKKFYNESDYRFAGSDSTFSEGSSTALYIQDLGFVESNSKGPNYRRHVELIEQMSVEEFEKRANHDEHRVGWIDPAKTISDDSDFTLCGHERRIADYYNSTPDGRYIHSKRAMLDTINLNLDKEKLFDQSGRLVFRFVVNCEGKAGRFIAEGYDMNYRPMEFDAETVDHLFGILQKLEEWRPVVLSDKARDAYFYITFNIDNGEIVDILP